MTDHNSGKTRICIVMGAHFSVSIGGAQFQAKMIAELLASSGQFEVFYLTRKAAKAYQPDSYAIRVFSKGKLGKLRDQLFLLDAPDLLRELNEIKPDIIYQRGLKGHTAICAYYAKKHNCKFFFHIAHDFDVMPDKMFGGGWRKLFGKVEKRLSSAGMQRATGVIAQTSRQAELLAKNYQMSAALVLPNLVELPAVSDNVPSGSMLLSEDGQLKVRIVWVANFKPVKQPQLFLELAKRFQDRPDVHFIMIGRSGDASFAALNEVILKQDNLTYLGELSLTEVNRWLASSDIFVNTSAAEGYPNTFLQAWVRHLPVVSLSVDIENQLGQGICGRLGQTIGGMAECLSELIDSPDLRHKLGENGYRYVLEHNAQAAFDRLVRLILV